VSLYLREWYSRAAIEQAGAIRRRYDARRVSGPTSSAIEGGVVASL
jgi:hypothetical protein